MPHDMSEWAAAIMFSGGIAVKHVMDDGYGTDDLAQSE